MADQFPLVMVVILNRNNAPDTLACLASVCRSDYSNYQLTVVDNASDDDSARLIAQTYPRATMLTSDRNLGFGGGMNIGIAHSLRARSDYVLLMNNDTIIAPNAITHLVQEGSRQADVGIFVPEIFFYYLPEVIWSAGAEWKRFPPRVKMIGMKKNDSPAFNKPVDLDYATGCVLLVKADVFEQIGLFDEGFFMYQEDYDFCYRSRQAGWRIRYTPEAKVWHKVSLGLGSGTRLWWYHWSRSTTRLYIHSWHYSTGQFGLILLWLMAREFAKGRVKFLMPMLAGVRDELHHLKLENKANA